MWIAVLLAPIHSNTVTEYQHMSIYCPLSKALGIESTVSILDVDINPSTEELIESSIPPWNKGLSHSEETKERIRLKALGRPSPRKGVILSEETKKKISEAKTPQNKGSSNPMYGKKHTEDTKKRWSEIRKDVTPWNKGIKHSEETKQKLKDAWLKRKQKKMDCEYV